MSLLGILNFFVLQWFFVRLAVSFDHVCVAREPGRWWDREIPVSDEIRFSLLRWVWPMTGWFGWNYRFISRNVRGE